MNTSKLVVPRVGRSVGSATTLLLSGSSLDDDSGEWRSLQRLLLEDIFVRFVSLRKRGERFQQLSFCYDFEGLLRLVLNSRAVVSINQIRILVIALVCLI